MAATSSSVTKRRFSWEWANADRKAAPLLAQKLGMDVIAVSMPPRDRPNGMSRQLLHLDSIFNFVDRDKVLAVPYFLEKAYVETNPMKKILAGLAVETDAIKARMPAECDGETPSRSG